MRRDFLFVLLAGILAACSEAQIKEVKVPADSIVEVGDTLYSHIPPEYTALPFPLRIEPDDMLALLAGNYIPNLRGDHANYWDEKSQSVKKLYHLPFLWRVNYLSIDTSLETVKSVSDLYIKGELCLKQYYCRLPSKGKIICYYSIDHSNLPFDILNDNEYAESGWSGFLIFYNPDTRTATIIDGFHFKFYDGDFKERRFYINKDYSIKLVDMHSKAGARGNVIYPNELIHAYTITVDEEGGLTVVKNK